MARTPSLNQASHFQQQIRQIETDSGGRLGVSVHDTHCGLAYAYPADERFPMCSTFKFLAAALVLSRVDQGQEQLSRRIAVQASDIVPYSSATQPRVGGLPMTVAELCDAAVTLSDNAAANLLLKSFGGPPALTAFARSLGDEFTRLDRIEPDPNEATPGDPRDHHHARRDAGDAAKNRDRPSPVARIAWADHPLADRQQNRRQEAARRAAEWLEGGRQDGWWRAWHQQRHRRAVATWAGACGRHQLSDAEFGRFGDSGSGDCGGWEVGGVGGVACLGCRLMWAWALDPNQDFVAEWDTVRLAYTL